MSDITDEPPQQPADRPATRFEVTLQPGAGQRSLAEVADLDLDRVPDPRGGVRLVVSAEEVDRLRSAGYAVTIEAERAVQPLDPSLVMDDDAARGWLDGRLAGTDAQEGR